MCGSVCFLAWCHDVYKRIVSKLSGSPSKIDSMVLLTGFHAGS